MPKPFEIIPLNRKGNHDGASRAIALGTFDGVHRGHQALLKTVREFAQNHQLIPSCTTFANPPIIWTDPDREVQSLSTLEERLSLLSRYGMEEVIVLNFPVISSIAPQDYLDRILKQNLKTSFICTGSNHRFGHKRTGDQEFLKSWSKANQIEVEIIEPLLNPEGQRISSSIVRQKLIAGDLIGANDLLGHRFLFTAAIVPGRKLGRQLGFPTINCLYATAKLAPRLGVYAAYALIGDRLQPAAVNIGYAPTASCDRIIRFETHLLGTVSQELLDQIGDRLTVELVDYIRPEMKFESLEALKDQIALDCQHISARL